MAEKKKQRQTVGGLSAVEGTTSSGGASLSGSSDTSSQFGPEYVPGGLGVAFIPITLVFKDLRSAADLSILTVC
jgi:hypothetical protein